MTFLFPLTGESHPEMPFSLNVANTGLTQIDGPVVFISIWHLCCTVFVFPCLWHFFPPHWDKLVRQKPEQSQLRGSQIQGTGPWQFVKFRDLKSVFSQLSTNFSSLPPWKREASFPILYTSSEVKKIHVSHQRLSSPGVRLLDPFVPEVSLRCEGLLVAVLLP